MTDSNNISHEKPLYRSKVKMIRFSLPLLSTSALLIDTKIHDNTIYVSLIPTIALSDKQKDIYKSAYHAILVFSNSLLMCAIANYWLFKTSSVTSYYEIVGIIGGLLKIAGSINHSTGRMSIYIIRSCIRNQITVMASTDSLVDDEIIL
jgi:hypothetical protein